MYRWDLAMVHTPSPWSESLSCFHVEIKTKSMKHSHWTLDITHNPLLPKPEELPLQQKPPNSDNMSSYFLCFLLIIGDKITSKSFSLIYSSASLFNLLDLILTQFFSQEIEPTHQSKEEDVQGEEWEWRRKHSPHSQSLNHQIMKGDKCVSL